MNLTIKFITFLVASVFFMQNALADPPGAKSGGTKTSSTPSKSTAPSKNNGNNPGNPNAPGYNGGGTKTASTPSKNTTPSKNNGNNPGNPNAPGYNGGGTKTASTPKSPSPSPISNAVSGAKTLVDRAVEIGKQAASKVKDVVVSAVEPHYNAVKAGIEAQKRATMGTIGAGSYGYQLSQERAYYKGVEEYYEKYNIKEKFVPTGPMAAKMRGVQVPEKEKELVDAVIAAADRAYRDEAGIIADPSKMSEEHIKQLVGEDLYNELKANPTQYLGFKKSTIVIADQKELARGAGKYAMALYNNGFYMDSIKTIYIDNSEKKRAEISEFRDLVLHETQHAGDSELYDYAMTDKKSELAARIVEILKPSEELKQNPLLEMYYPEYYNPKLKYTDGGYITTLTEMRAFAQTDLNKKDWADQFAQDYAVDPIEAEMIGTVVLESPFFQADLETTDKYAEQLLGGQK